MAKFKQYNIIHLATHAAFVTGNPEDSFVMFGDGSRDSLRDVSTWSLKNVDPKLTKAEVLAKAPRSMINQKSSDNSQGFNHPYFWSPFIIIGNGLL